MPFVTTWVLNKCKFYILDPLNTFFSKFKTYIDFELEDILANKKKSSKFASKTFNWTLGMLPQMWLQQMLWSF